MQIPLAPSAAGLVYTYLDMARQVLANGISRLWGNVTGTLPPFRSYALL